MAETKQIVALVLLTLVVGTLGVFLVTYLPLLVEGDVVVDTYHATWYPNGTLVEDFTYDVRVSGQYRMLYRTWDASLSYFPLSSQYVAPVSV